MGDGALLETPVGEGLAKEVGVGLGGELAASARVIAPTIAEAPPVMTAHPTW